MDNDDRALLAYWRWYIELMQRVLSHPAMADDSTCDVMFSLDDAFERCRTDYESGKTVTEVFLEIDEHYNKWGMVMTATGFDIQPLPTDDVLIEFFGDDGMTFNSQVMTRDCLNRMPVVATALRLLLDQGVDEAIKYLIRNRGISNDSQKGCYE